MAEALSIVADTMVSTSKDPFEYTQVGRSSGYAGGEANRVLDSLVSAKAYLPVTRDVRCVHFKWARACHVYHLHDSSVTHKGGGVMPYRPVIGDLAMAPQTGKFYFEIKVNTDNCRIGLCTGSTYSSARSLEECELGSMAPFGDANDTAVDSDDQNDTSYAESNRSTSLIETPHVVHLEVHSSRVFVNGQEVKQLWRLFVPTAGGLFGFVVDTEEGVVQLFFNKKYAGTVFDPSAKLKGLTLYPCVGFAGSDTNNRNIGSGIFGATISRPQRFDGMY